MVPMSYIAVFAVVVCLTSIGRSGQKPISGGVRVGAVVRTGELTGLKRLTDKRIDVLDGHGMYGSWRASVRDESFVELYVKWQ